MLNLSVNKISHVLCLYSTGTQIGIGLAIFIVYFAEVLLTMPFFLLLTASQLFDLTHSVLWILNNTYSAVTIYIRSPIVLLSCFF